MTVAIGEAYASSMAENNIDYSCNKTAYKEANRGGLKNGGRGDIGPVRRQTGDGGKWLMIGGWEGREIMMDLRA